MRRIHAEVRRQRNRESRELRREEHVHLPMHENMPRNHFPMRVKMPRKRFPSGRIRW
jgi:hypothetical protein